MLGALLLMERARRKLSTSRFPGLIFDPIAQTFMFIIGLIPGWRRAARRRIRRAEVSA